MRSCATRGRLALALLAMGLTAGCSATSSDTALAPGEDAMAVSIIDQLRQQFRVTVVDPLSGATSQVPFLKASYIVATSLEGSRPSFGIDPAAGVPSADFDLPEMSDAQTSLRPRGRGLSLSFAPKEAVPVGARLGRGYLLFSSAHPRGGHMIRGATAEGLEDYVVFPQEPPEAALRYRLELGDEVAGLRRVGNTLEALDAQGASQLRITEPTLIDSNGQVVTATLDIEGCVADTDPSPPEGRPVLPPYGRSCTVVVSWTGAALTYPVLVDPTWVSAGNMVFARANFTLTWMPSGYVYAIGGLGSDGHPVQTSELYDPATNTWGLRQPLHYARSRHTATPLWNGKILITGGLRDGNVATATTELVDLASTYDDTAALPGARYDHTATPLPNGNVLVFGGLTSASSATALGDASIYNPTTDKWLAAPSRTARYGHTATPLSDGTVLVAGGLNGAGLVLGAELYKPSSNVWAAAGTLNTTGRAYHTATLMHDGKVLVAGGGVPSIVGLVPLSNVDLYDAGAWKVGPPMNVPRAYATANLLPDGKVLVVGGYGLVGGTVNLVASSEVYDPDTQKWTLLESTASTRGFHASVSVPNSNAKRGVANPSVVIAGGYASATSIARSAELITTASCTGWMSPGDGSGGVFEPAANTVLPSGLYQFAAINIPSGVKVTASGSGVLDLRVVATASVSGSIDVSGSIGGGGHSVDEDKKGGNGGGGATGNPDSPGAEGRNNTCYDGVALGGDGSTGSGKGGKGSRCQDGGGKYGGGVGGACDGAYENQKPGSGAGGGGYGGGGGGVSSAFEPALGGAGGGTYGAPSNEGYLGHYPGLGGIGPSVYAGANGSEDYATGGGGGSIGSDAAGDLAALSTFRTGSGGGGGGAQGDDRTSAKCGGGGGGGGGGAVRIVSAGLTRVRSGGSVLAQGGDGGHAQRQGAGGGGGGSGGLIVLSGDTLSVLGKVSTAGGTGGTNGSTGTGGAGGMGRVVLSAGSQSGCNIASSQVTPTAVGGCVASTGAQCIGSETACGAAYVRIGASVCAGLVVTPIALSAPYTNLSYAASVTLSGSGGTGIGYSYSMLTSNTLGTVAASTGVYTAGSRQGIDTVQVTDSVGNKATIALTVFPLIATGSAATVFPRGTLTFSATGGQGLYSWRVEPNRSGATIDPTTGRYVAGRTGSVTDTVRVTDGLGGSAGFDVAVKAGITLTPASASLTPKGQKTFSATGGSGTGYLWTVPTYPSGGAHPDTASSLYQAGNSGGVTDVVRITDSLGNFADALVTVGPSVTITTPTVNVVLGGMVSLQATGGSSTGYTWMLTSKPSGGSIDPVTGVYTAGSTGAVSDIAQVTDSLGATGTATLHVAKPIVISPVSLDAFKPKDQKTFTASGGSGTGYTWLVTGGSGATIGATTGIYKAGANGYTQDTVQVTDSFGNVATAQVNVGPGVSLSPSLTTVTQKGSSTFTASGGSGGPYTWLLPTDGHGTISASGVYTAGTDCLYAETITVRDALQNSASATVQVGVCFSIVASATTVPASTGKLTLTTVGGSGSGLNWKLAPGGSGGSIAASTGVYTAGPTRNTTDTITATDSLSNTTTIAINVY